MKKVFKFTNLLMLTLLLTTYSCGDDDDDEVNVINVQNLEVTIDENPTNGAIVGTVTTTQTVGGGTLAYSITTQTPTGALNIDATTGELTVADATLFDFETNPVLTATVEVAGTTNTGTVTINLNDLNEIGIQDLNVTIDENPTAGQAIGTVLTSGTGSIDFSITSATPAGAMSIDASTGELTVADVTLFDFERNPIITAVISSVGTLSTGTVTINLNDLNEVGVQDLTVTIDENPTVGQVIGTVLTSGTGSIDFSITSATPAGAMSIDASTGELTVLDATLFDFEINPTITAVVSSAGALNTGTVTINLNDLNEISAQDLTVTIDENPTTGQAVGTIQVTGGGTLSFSITSQTPAGALNINASTGELTVADPNLFDFETTPVITADISVNNLVSTATAIATINLNDVDEISVQALTVEMDENPTSGQVIGTLQATSSEILSYTITYQNPAGAFDINSSTGELTVDDASLFDFETNPNMLATISVDNGVYSVSANAYIDLNDLNEAAAIGDFRDGGIVFWVDPADNT
ncbi:MAG: cadherin repeat domain-containing protein, partial [Cellulophaga sp.]